ncbi:MAG TPA: choice-of-anchor tandem repeat GloVer-containing protein [Terriglobia bacterium]|jgi:hypothetical protein|nr:choice-of-anchor tandem repeat GloVer-containing protein [Terriglobia bacterium]
MKITTTAVVAVIATAVWFSFLPRTLPAQTFTTLLSFDNSDGANPWGGLVQAANGNLYGTTALGGANDTCAGGYGCGTVFKILRVAR